MGCIEYLVTAFFTIPMALWDLADFGLSIYKYSYHDTPYDAYGHAELVTILVFGCFKAPVALACLWIWFNGVRDAGICGPDAEKKWTEVNGVVQIPKLITALCDIPLMVCNVRILGHMNQDGLSASPSQLVSTDLFNSLVVALYVSIVIEVVSEVLICIFRIAGQIKTHGCACLTCDEKDGGGNGWFLVLELAFLGMAFFCLRISYDLQLHDEGTQLGSALYVIALGCFAAGFFYVAFRFFMDKLYDAQENSAMDKYMGCTTKCTSSDLDCAACFLFFLALTYLILCVFLCATILGMGWPESNSVFQVCTAATLSMGGFLLTWLFLARVLAQCCCGSDDAQQSGVQMT